MPENCLKRAHLVTQQKLGVCTPKIPTSHEVWKTHRSLEEAPDIKAERG